MVSTFQRWSSRVRAVPYRELLNAPGIARAHDTQRLLSYGLGVGLSLIIEMPRWRSLIIFAISLVMLLATIRRLMTGPSSSPYLIAVFDQLVATSLIALATGSILITLTAIGVIVIAVAATFDASPEMHTGVGALTIAIALPKLMKCSFNSVGPYFSNIVCSKSLPICSVSLLSMVV